MNSEQKEKIEIYRNLKMSKLTKDIEGVKTECLRANSCLDVLEPGEVFFFESESEIMGSPKTGSFLLVVSMFSPTCITDFPVGFEGLLLASSVEYGKDKVFISNFSCGEIKTIKRVSFDDLKEYSSLPFKSQLFPKATKDFESFLFLCKNAQKIVDSYQEKDEKKNSSNNESILDELFKDKDVPFAKRIYELSIEYWFKSKIDHNGEGHPGVMGSNGTEEYESKPVEWKMSVGHLKGAIVALQQILDRRYGFKTNAG